MKWATLTKTQRIAYVITFVVLWGLAIQSSAIMFHLP